MSLTQRDLHFLWTHSLAEHFIMKCGQRCITFAQICLNFFTGALHNGMQNRKQFLLLDDGFGRLYFFHFLITTKFDNAFKICLWWNLHVKTKYKFFFKVLEPSATVIRDKTLIYKVPKADNSCCVLWVCQFILAGFYFVFKKVSSFNQSINFVNFYVSW